MLVLIYILFVSVALINVQLFVNKLKWCVLFFLIVQTFLKQWQCKLFTRIANFKLNITHLFSQLTVWKLILNYKYNTILTFTF